MELTESRTGKLVFVRLVEDEDLLETVTKAARKAQVSAGFFFLIGTLKKAKLGFFRDGKYETVEKDQPLEIVSCLGNMSIREDKIFAHAHIAVSDDEGRVFGGHAMPGCVIAATGELVLVEAKGINLIRKLDEKTKLYLWTMRNSVTRSEKKASSFT